MCLPLQVGAAWLGGIKVDSTVFAEVFGSGPTLSTAAVGGASSWKQVGDYPGLLQELRLAIRSAYDVVTVRRKPRP